MEFFLTSLEIFENYKNSNPQKCKGKSAIEICKLAGLDDRQIADLQASSAWLFYFDKENTSTPPNLNMTEIFGGEFSNDTDRNTESTKDVNTIVNNLMNICNDKNFLTRDLNEIEEIINNDVNEKNVVEFLSDFNKKNAKSFFDVIADYKFTNDTTRMDILLNLVSKLEKASNDRGQDLSIIISKLKEKIRYEFRSVGLISKRNINALFNAVVMNLQRNRLNEPSKMANEFNEEFEIKAGVKYEFKENIQKDKNKIYGKTCTYKLADGTQLLESYIYDLKSNKFYLEEKSWLDKDNNIIKIAEYYPNEPQTISSVHYYENGMQVESNHFRPDGIPSYKFVVNGDNYKAITYSKDGKPVEIRTIENKSDDETRKDTTVRYNTEGFELVDVNPKDSTHLSIEEYYSIDKEQLRELFVSKHSLATIPYMASGWSLFADDWGADIVCDIMETLAQKTLELGADRNIDISDLNTKLNTMLQKKDVTRAAAILKQMLARVTKAYSVTDYKNYKNDLSFDSLYNEFSQGHFGTCWLTASVKALLLTEDGKKLLESAVKYNENTGEVTVTLKGTPKGIRTYVYSKEQIAQASELSTGNGMERAIEMAFRDMFMEFSRTQLHHRHDIEGNNTAQAFEIITGKEPDSYCAYLGQVSYKIDEALATIKNMKEYSCICGFLGDFYSFIPPDDNGTVSDCTRIRTGHAYVLQNVDDNFVYLINPWDTSKTIKIKLKDFKKYCEQISIAQF